MWIPKVSVIVPVYNKAPFVRRCLDSIAEQYSKDVQVIVVDDGSSDGSSEICEEYSKCGFEIYHRKNGGVSVARNFGMRKAKGEYITFLDADDEYADGALDVMCRISRHGFNIIQFGQYRCHAVGTKKDRIVKGKYGLERMPKRWAMVWNKMYRREFVVENKLKFIRGMQFGEDEMFNAEAILANDGLYHAPQTTILHYFDDKESLCRGELSLKRLERLTRELRKLGDRQEDESKKQWCRQKARAHEESDLFRRFGFKGKTSGKWDVVYFVKNSFVNEELRYSLRSVEKNWQFNKVWFYGGSPEGLKPDYQVSPAQAEPSKWERVRSMILKACKNDKITENFWLFNDDFFILQPTPETEPPQYNKTLREQIAKVRSRHAGEDNDYTRRLAHLIRTLESDGKPTLNYSVHKPILINRKKAVEVLEKYPNEPMFRALYGNYWKIGGRNAPDHKIAVDWFDIDAISKWEFVSTADESFKDSNIGKWLRSKFDKPSRWEL